MKEFGTPNFRKVGYLAYTHCRVVTDVEVLRSARGFYIGVVDHNRLEPMSRESVEYYSTRSAAQQALNTGTWTQRTTP